MKIPFIKKFRNEINVSPGIAARTWTVFPDIYADSIKVTNGTVTSVDLPAVKQAVDVISNALANLPVRVVDRDGNEQKNTNLANILNKKPNDYMSPIQFRKFLYEQYVRTGNGFAVVNYNSISRVPISFDPVFLERARWQTQPDGRNVAVYKLRKLNERTGQEYTRDEIIHLTGDSYDGLLAKNPLQDVAPIAEGMKQSMKMFLKSLSSVVNGVSYFEADMEKISDMGVADVSEYFEKAVAVIEDSSKKGAAVLPLGIKHSGVVKSDAIDQTVLSYMQHSIEEIARIFNIGPRYLGVTRNVRISQELTQMGEDFLRVTLMPRVQHINYEYSRFLAKDNIANGYEVKLDTTSVAKGTFRDLVETADKLYTSTLGTKDEGREYIGLQAVGGEEGGFRTNIPGAAPEEFNPSETEDNDGDK